MKLIKKHPLLIIFLTLYFLVIAYKFISHPTPFYDWDEAINVEVSREMIEQKSLIPLWQGAPWLDKPPLPFLLFGTVLKLTPFVQPEVSLRIVSLLLSLISLILIYFVFYKACRNRSISLLTVIMTSLTPIFLQRSQIVNLDVFLLIGWLGYLLFFDNFILSFLFLAIAVLTKSLIGFYAAGIILLYYFYLLFKSSRLRSKAHSDSANAGEPRRLIKMVLIQIGILSLWYFAMFLVFKEAFWQQHIIETHLRRVTASIESHFGQRTYYIDLLFEQMGFFAWLSIIGFLVMLWRFISKKLTADNLIFCLFLLPWFLFLNLTKTKIFWYLFPAIPQFAFLAVYPLTLFKKDKKPVPYLPAVASAKVGLLSVILLVFIFYQNFSKADFFKTFYSKPEDYYRLALYAKDRCDSLTVLVDKNTRDSTKTLEDLGLTISSTKQWGDHPSIVYYFKKKVDFLYTENGFAAKLITPKMCIATQNSDTSVISQNFKLKKIKTIGDYSLFKEIKTY